MCYHSAEFGGVEKQILDIIKGLSKEIEITVLCPSGPLVSEYLKAGAKRHIEMTPKAEFDLLYSFRIAKLVKTEGYDIVHGHELKAGSLAIFGAWMGRSPKRIYHVHTPFSQWKYTGLKRFPALFINTFVNFVVGNLFATKVIALTKSIRDIRIHKEFIFRSKIKVIPNGLDVQNLKFTDSGRSKVRQLYKVSNDTLLFGLVSRLTAEKGHIDLIQAYAEFRKLSSQKTKLLIAGGGSLLSETTKLARDLRISDYVVFTGRFTDKDKASLYSAIDVFVFPTHAEGFGYVMLEAMSVGIPVIANDIQILRDVGGDAIIYTDARNSQALAKTMQKVANDVTLQSFLKEKGREQVKKYSMENFIQKYKKLYLS